MCYVFDIKFFIKNIVKMAYSKNDKYVNYVKVEKYI